MKRTVFMSGLLGRVKPETLVALDNFGTTWRRSVACSNGFKDSGVQGIQEIQRFNVAVLHAALAAPGH
jgi:hypothetical protein